MAVDLPLHGRTPAAVDQDFTLGGLARVIADFCDALQLDQVDLVANDTAGAVAQVFAVNHVGRVRTMTLTNCDTHDNLPPDALKPAVELAASGQLAAMVPQLIGDLDVARTSGIGVGYEHPERVADDILRAYLDPVVGTPERTRQLERPLTALDAAELTGIEPQLRRFDKPTLVVWGTGDPFFEVKWASWLADTIPGVTQVILIEGARLFFPEERPARRASAIPLGSGRSPAMTAAPLKFGIYPLGVAGSPTGLAAGPPDDYPRVHAALDDLGGRVVARTYLVDMEPGAENAALALGDRFRSAGLLGHVTLGCLRDTGFEVDRWVSLVRTVVRRYGDPSVDTDHQRAQPLVHGRREALRAGRARPRRRRRQGRGSPSRRGDRRGFRLRAPKSRRAPLLLG